MKQVWQRALANRERPPNRMGYKRDGRIVINAWYAAKVKWGVTDDELESDGTHGPPPSSVMGARLDVLRACFLANILPQQVSEYTGLSPRQIGRHYREFRRRASMKGAA